MHGKEFTYVYNARHRLTVERVDGSNFVKRRVFTICYINSRLTVGVHLLYLQQPSNGSMTGILEELKWETLQKRRKDNRLILMYKGLKGNARIPTDDLIPKNRRCRNQHSMVFQIPSASKDSYKKSFFPLECPP